jgi:DNA-binding MarR family transcriptional regulator
MTYYRAAQRVLAAGALFFSSLLRHNNCAMSYQSILMYLARAYEINPEAEVSGAELQFELGLSQQEVDDCVRRLAHEGLVEWDPLLTNTWLRVTDSGLAAASDVSLG